MARRKIQTLPMLVCDARTLEPRSLLEVDGCGSGCDCGYGYGYGAGA